MMIEARAPEEQPAGGIHVVPTAQCPSCAAPLVMALTPAGSQQADDRKPRAGDLTICVYCGALLCWRRDMGLRRFPRSAYRHLSEEEQQEIRRVQAMVYVLRLPRGR